MTTASSVALSDTVTVEELVLELAPELVLELLKLTMLVKVGPSLNVMGAVVSEAVVSGTVTAIIVKVCSPGTVAVPSPVATGTIVTVSSSVYVGITPTGSVSVGIGSVSKGLGVSVVTEIWVVSSIVAVVSVTCAYVLADNNAKRSVFFILKNVNEWLVQQDK